MQLKVYISSTYEDLKKCRDAVYDALRKVRADAIAMENYVAQDQRPLQKCLEDVASSNIYVGIFAWRYGYIPNDNKENPNNLSITELEYRKAKEKGIPCLIFLLDEIVPWPLKFSDGTPQSATKGDNINRLRNELKQNHSISFFKNPDELASNVLAAVTQLISEENQLSLQSSFSFSSFKTIVSANEIKSSQKKIPLFRGEKSGFLGRQEYIDKEIKKYFKTPGSVISIIGPGGSGKSQLAFKAIRQYYEKDCIFDIVIPIYFDINLMTFDEFLSKIAEKILPASIEINEFENRNIEERKDIIRNALCEKTHPLIYIDNFETVSLLINDVKPKEQYQLEDARKIKYFLNNDIPDNTSIFFTSRERNNLGGKEKHIDLKGLDNHESKELFCRLVADEYLRDPSSERVQKTIEIFYKK